MCRNHRRAHLSSDWWRDDSAWLCHFECGQVVLGSYAARPLRPYQPRPDNAFPSGGSLTCGDGIGSNASPCNLLAVDPNLKTPYIENFNLGIQHQFGNNLSLEIGYVGNHGARLTGFADINQAAAGSLYCLNGLTAAQIADACNGFVAPVTVGDYQNLIKGKAPYKTLNGTQAAQESRPLFTKFPYIGFVNQMSNNTHSNYNSLQATLTKRMSHGLSFIAGYTYAHGLDTGSLNRFGMIPQDGTADQYGNSDFDVRHRFTLSATYDIPGIKGYGQALEGWQVNGIVNIQCSQPWRVNDGGNNFNGANDNADLWNFTGNPASFTSTVILRERSPRATAVVTSAMLRTWRSD